MSVMTNRLDKALHDARGNLRVKENKPVSWKSKEGKGIGHGRVRNISLTGMLLETDTVIDSNEHGIFSFNFSSAQNGYIPETGRIVWKRKKKFSRNKHLCGIEFLEPNESSLNGLRDKVQDGIKRFTTQRKWKMFLNVLFITGIMGLTAYSLWMGVEVYQNMNASTQRMIHVAGDQAALTRNYGILQKETEQNLDNVTEELILTTEQLTSVQQELNKTQQLYKEGKGMLQGVSKDLETAKAALAQTEQMLTQARADNKTFKGDRQALKELYGKRMVEMKVEMNNTIALLQEKNIKLTSEMTTLQGQLAYYGGDVKNMDEGKSLLKLYRSRMKLVKSKIKYFKQEVREVRKTALKERDSIQSLLGNNGYFMKNGETVKVNEKQYQLATLEAEDSVNTKKVQPERKVKIDVTFFK